MSTWLFNFFPFLSQLTSLYITGGALLVTKYQFGVFWRGGGLWTLAFSLNCLLTLISPFRSLFHDFRYQTCCFLFHKFLFVSFVYFPQLFLEAMPVTTSTTACLPLQPPSPPPPSPPPTTPPPPPTTLLIGRYQNLRLLGIHASGGDGMGSHNFSAPRPSLFMLLPPRE